MLFLGLGRAYGVRQPATGRRLARATCVSLAVLAAALPSKALAKVRLSGLADVNFGAVSNLETDVVQAQNVCLYSQSNRYSIRADGSGTSGEFTLTSGNGNLAYEVRWNGQAGQTNGTALSPGTALGGLTTNALNQQCSGNGPSTTASLILILPATALSTAVQGSYSGTLTLLVSEE